MYQSAQTSNKSRGYTLIELLIVILIIATLSGIILGVVNSIGIRSKGIDGQRATDLKKIQTALEVYFADNNSYPSTGGTWEQVNAGSALHSGLTPDYLNVIPTDPGNELGGNINPCGTPEFNRYNYNTSATGGSYVLTAVMEIDSSNDGFECASLQNWASLGCNPPVSNCYGVENP